MPRRFAQAAVGGKGRGGGFFKSCYRVATGLPATASRRAARVPSTVTILCPHARQTLRRRVCPPGSCSVLVTWKERSPHRGQRIPRAGGSPGPDEGVGTMVQILVNEPPFAGGAQELGVEQPRDVI